MRLDDPRLAALAARDGRRPVRGRVVRRGVGRPPAVHRRGAARGRPRAPRPPQGPPAHVRAVRRAAVLRPGRHAAGGAVAAGRRASGSRCARTSGTSRRPRCSRNDGAQILINVSSSPGRDLARDERGGPRDRDLVADADAHLRAAHDLVRGVLQPGRRRRDDLVLGRVRGDLADRRPGVQRPDVRRGPVLRRHRPRRRAPGAHLAAAAARRAAGAGRARVAPARRRAGGPGRRLDGGARAPRPASTWRSTRHRSGERRPRRCSSCPRSSRSTPASRGGSIAEFIRGQLRQAGFERAVLGPLGRDRLGARRVPHRGGDRRRAAALRADAVPDVVAGLARRTPRRSSRRLGLLVGAGRDHADGRRLLRAPTATPGEAGPEGLEAAPLRRGNFMARMRMSGPVRPVGHVARARRGDRATRPSR